MLYVGIDPGSSWCGFAALEITSDNVVRAEARTYSVKNRRNGWLDMVGDLFNLLPHARRTSLVVEDFQIRQSGHQRFDHGDTLRFLGALEHGARGITMFDFHLIAPNDRGDRENRLLYGRILDHYRKKWPGPRRPPWSHCVSAWRVLGYHLMKREPEMLIDAQKMRRVHRGDHWLPLVRNDADFIAPAVTWT